MASNKPVKLISAKKALGAEMTGKYATVSSVDRIIKNLQFFYIIGTTADTTTDGTDLEVGDIVIQIEDAAATSHYMTVVTAGTLPEAFVANDLYIVLRPGA
tara:strand:+ start:2417 stop:2719 length:303 start_codon:yes stop_codon:yes gene_type:complete